MGYQNLLLFPLLGEGLPEPARFDAERLLEQTKTSHTERLPALGQGEDLRLSGPTLTGAALVVDGRILHLCAFGLHAVPEEGAETGTRLVRAPRRGWGWVA